MDASLVYGELAVVEFEVDDQTPEDLTLGLDRLREMPAVYDVLQTPAYGKKGRLVMHIRVLADPVRLPDLIAACFVQTTTIGLRLHVVATAALPRRVVEVDMHGTRMRVKLVDRPEMATAKAEVGDVAVLPGGHARRVALREAAQREAIACRTHPPFDSSNPVPSPLVRP